MSFAVEFSPMIGLTPTACSVLVVTILVAAALLLDTSASNGELPVGMFEDVFAENEIGACPLLPLSMSRGLVLAATIDEVPGAMFGNVSVAKGIAAASFENVTLLS